VKKAIEALLIIVATVAAAQGVSGGACSDLSTAKQGIAEACKAISEKPKEYAGYNLLATALVLRAQETFDAAFYAQAEEAVKKSFALSPDNFETQKIQVSVLMGKHEYPTALEQAQALNKRVPDDLTVYALLTDAEVELGKYDDAEDSATWMLNLRRGNRPAYIRAARLREIFGDADGAYEMADLALQSTIPSETGERASLLTQMGHFRLASGNIGAAEKLFQQALATFPGYPCALENLAQVRITQKRYTEAVGLLQQRYQGVASRGGNLYDLAEALQLAGRNDEAKKAFSEFETKSLLESGKKDNSNRELVFYYSDHVRQPAKALDMAKQDYTWRRDVYTLDAYAWALHVNGQDAEARKQIEAVLAVGIRDSRIFAHAGEIALKLGDRTAAENYLQEAVSLHAVGSEHAQVVLAQISVPSKQR
jgi:predicted Zn-dependent protease